MVMLSVVSLAVYVTDWIVVSVTVKVTTPLLLEAPLAAEIVEFPVTWVRVTVLPLAGLLPEGNVTRTLSPALMA